MTASVLGIQLGFSYWKIPWREGWEKTEKQSLLSQADDFPSRDADPYIATLYCITYQITYTISRLH